jgi:hypothetical protein
MLLAWLLPSAFVVEAARVAARVVQYECREPNAEWTPLPEVAAASSAPAYGGTGVGYGGESARVSRQCAPAPSMTSGACARAASQLHSLYGAPLWT